MRVRRGRPNRLQILRGYSRWTCRHGDDLEWRLDGDRECPIQTCLDERTWLATAVHLAIHEGSTCTWVRFVGVGDGRGRQAEDG